jgi:hypothetical protein
VLSLHVKRNRCTDNQDRHRQFQAFFLGHKIAENGNNGIEENNQRTTEEKPTQRIDQCWRPDVYQTLHIFNRIISRQNEVFRGAS